MKLVLRITGVLLFLCVLKTNAQSGWTQPKGKYYFKLSGQHTKSDKHFNSNRVETNNPEQGIFAINAYLEYGLSDKFTLIAFAPFINTIFVRDDVPGNDIITPEENTQFIGDTELGLKYGFFKYGPINTALTVRFRLPTGGGEFNQAAILSTGLSLGNAGPFSFYGNLYGGANNRGRGFSAEGRFGGELGVGYKQKLWLAFKQDNILSFRNKTNVTDELALQLFGNNFENQTWALETSYFITDKMGVSVNYTKPFRGRLALTSPTINAGLFWNVR